MSLQSLGKTNQITIWIYIDCHLFSSVQSLSRVWLFVTPWTAACQAFLSITNSLSLPKLMSIESVMPFNHLILCRPLLLLPSIFPSIRVFSNESALCIRWPKYWSFSFNTSSSNTLSNKYKACEFIIQSYLTLCDPMDCNLPDSSVHRILQARITGAGSHSFLQGFSWPRDWTGVSCTLGIFFTIWATKEAQ